MNLSEVETFAIAGVPTDVGSSLAVRDGVVYSIRLMLDDAGGHPAGCSHCIAHFLMKGWCTQAPREKVQQMAFEDDSVGTNGVSHEHCTLVDYFRAALLSRPEQRTYQFLCDREGDVQCITNAELDRRARAVATTLRDRIPAGERALIVCPPSIDYITSFFACLYAGVIAVPVYPPNPLLLKRTLPRLIGVIEDASPAVVLAPASVAAMAEEYRKHAAALGALSWVAVDEIREGAEASWERPMIEGRDVAFLQYTSGSTGQPKGVMVSHANLLHNLRAIKQQMVGELREPHGVSWLPPYHDMGLIGGLLQPAYVQCPVVLMSPVTFLKRPLRWLKAISALRGTSTISGGPNFAYDLCVARVSEKERQELDLSNWEVAFTGAEPVRAETVERFSRFFEPCGFRRNAFYPCYGLAEGTLFVSGGHKKLGPVTRRIQADALADGRAVDANVDESFRTIVGCGTSVPGQGIVIVDPETRTRLPPGRVGEIWVSGASVAKGFWRRPEESKEVFSARLADAGEGPFLRTGDLGFLDCGELFVTGRIKDLIVIAGRNHYPQDIERSIEECVSGVRIGCSVAFSVDVEDEEQLIIVCEPEGKPAMLDVDRVVSSVRAAVSEEHGLQVHAVVLVRRGHIPKTSSGKLQRSACKRAYLDGSLESVVESRTPSTGTNRVDSASGAPVVVDDSGAAGSEIRQRLLQELAKRLNLKPEDLDASRPLATYGLRSVDMVGLIGELELFLGRKLPATLAWEYPTVDALAGFLSSSPRDDVALASRADQIEQTAAPIAIIGIGCRFPGGVVDPDTYWKLLSSGIDAISEVPEDRWNIDSFYHEEVGRPGKMTTRWGGFLDHVDYFDCAFFGISQREAVAMDPQQRLVLEVAWEALEHSGQAPARLAGSRSGVFLGVHGYDYAVRHFSHPSDVSAYAATGTAHSVVAGRLSYFLDLRGPCVALDTACSSSLVAVHLACQSLRNGECDLAIGGGVNLILSPLPTIAFSQFGMMSVDGRCKAFDAAANGFVRGEGCGIVILKRLSDALADGDDVLAVLRGTVVNQDGRSNGLTAPSASAQRDLLRRALDISGIEPRDVSYIEAHGTGTPVGDPIEIEALSQVYRTHCGEKWYLGSAKTNFGHLEAAAGIAGLIKVVLALRHHAVPAHVHFERLNPRISIENLPFVIPTKLTEWRGNSDGRRIAGVSSFGFSGTNAHVIVEEGLGPTPRVETNRRPLSLLALSAKSQPALVALARKYGDYLERDKTAPVADLCFSANSGRSHFQCRLALVGESKQELKAQLDAFLSGNCPVRTGRVGDQNTGIVFLFTGQGAQRTDMSRILYETQPTFRKVLDRCDEILRPRLATSLLSVLYSSKPESNLIDQTAYAQPALFAVEYALTEMWCSWGVKPAAVLGHSLGEYVAACVSGVMTLEAGLGLVAERARLMQAIRRNGAMAVVFAPAAELADTIAQDPSRLSIAALNGPANTVVSGVREAVLSMCANLNARGFRTELLRVSHAFHSELIEPILDSFRQTARTVTFAPPRIPLLSNLTGKLWPRDKAPDADYWCDQARMPVRFGDAVETLRRLGYDRFLEIGPSPTLLGMAKQCVPTDRTLLLPSLRRGQSDWQVVLSSLAELYMHGTDVDWRGFDHDYVRSRVSVPTYPFERIRCWYESPGLDGSAQADRGEAANLSEDIVARSADAADEDLLYRIDWKSAAAAPTTPQTRLNGEQAWVILADEIGIGDELASRVAERGLRCIHVVPGSDYCYNGERLARVRVADRNDLMRLLRESGIDGDKELQVVHLWSLGAIEQDSTEGMLIAQKRGCMSAVCLIQALSRAGRIGPTRLWLVTRGVQPIGENSASLAVSQSTLWGLGRSLQLEHPELWGGLIDLDPEETPHKAASQLLHEIEQCDGEDQVAIRRGERHLARLVRKSIVGSTAAPTIWRANASYLITGGLGDLGLAVARSMVLKGARRLVLVGRTAMPPRGQWADFSADSPEGRRVTAVRELESLGASVHIESLDVADETQMRTFLERFEKEGWPPIRGIVHAAGLVEARPLLELESTDLERHLRPKLIGSWLLHRLLADKPLDFFVLFSSASAVLSSPFVASYAAANAFLDALAQQRQREGRPGLSINWGFWADIGVAARQAKTGPRATHGTNGLRPHQALRLFHRMLRQEEAQLTVMSIDWSEWFRSHQDASNTRLLATIMADCGSTPTEFGASPTGALLSRRALLELSPEERLNALTSDLVACVKAALRSEGPLRVEHPLFEMGLDSLIAVELKNQIETQLGVSVPIALFFRGASIQHLAEQILMRFSTEEKDGKELTSGPREIPRLDRCEDATEKLLSEIDQLSEEEAMRLLAGEESQ